MEINQHHRIRFPWNLFLCFRCALLRQSRNIFVPVFKPPFYGSEASSQLESWNTWEHLWLAQPSGQWFLNVGRDHHHMGNLWCQSSLPHILIHCAWRYDQETINIVSTPGDFKAESPRTLWGTLLCGGTALSCTKLNFLVCGGHSYQWAMNSSKTIKQSWDDPYLQCVAGSG